MTSRPHATLARGTLSLREVLFQSIAAMAPGGALAVSIAVAATYAGGALPLAVILGFLPCLTVAVSIGQLSKFLPSAGSIYTYPARALHPNLGFLVGWGYALSAAAWCPAVALMTSFQVSAFVASGSRATFQLVWPMIFVGTSFAIMLLGYRGVNVSARVGTALGTIEILVFAGLAACMIVAAGPTNSFAPFGIEFANVSQYPGSAGVLVAAVFTVQAFVGFEAATPLAEEAIEPKRTIMRATLFACICIGIFYLLTTYAAVVFRGPRTFYTFGEALEQANPWSELARRVWGTSSIAVYLAVLSSNLGAQNAFANAASRTWFAMARIELLPSGLSRTHSRWKSPHVAILTQFAFTLVVGAAAGFIFGPVDGSVLLATIGTAIPLGVYILTNLSCLVYFARHRRGDFNVLLHGVLPVAGIALLIPILMAALGIGSRVLPFATPLPYPISISGPVLIAWYCVGVVYLAYLRRCYPARLQRTAEIFSGG